MTVDAKTVYNAIMQAARIVEKASEHGLDVSLFKSKIESAIGLLDADILTIALLGSFSDGKTTVVAGLLRQILDNMKIDANESSDEITVYEADFLGKTFRIVDTPGLFGSKEKADSTSKPQKLSDITKKYISEANFVVYVTDAVNPLPDSHHDELRYILRNLRKLDKAVFVINKMDKAYDMLDKGEFAEGCSIKTEVLRNRLRKALGLTPAEEKELTIVCLAADPKARGIQYWLDRQNDYESRSNINALRQVIVDNTAAVDAGQSNIKAALDTAVDVVEILDESISEVRRPAIKAELGADSVSRDMHASLSRLENEAVSNEKVMREELLEIQQKALLAVTNASLENFATILTSEIGCEGENITFGILLRKIDNCVNACVSQTNSAVEHVGAEILRDVKIQQQLFENGLKEAPGLLKNVKITPEMIGKIRDMFFRNFKFKPWGKIRLAKNIGKWTARVGAGITVGLEIYDWYSKIKADKNLKKAKDAVCAAITRIFDGTFLLFADQDTFVRNFAPGLLELRDIISQKDAELEELRRRIADMESWQTELRNWRKEYTEDIEFTDI